jgi:glutaredoxin
MIKIQIVSMPDCAHCEHATRVLREEIKREFPEVKIESVSALSEEGMQLVQKYAIMTSPGIIINGRLFSTGELDRERLSAELRRLASKSRGTVG